MRHEDTHNLINEKSFNKFVIFSCHVKKRQTTIQNYHANHTKAYQTYSFAAEIIMLNFWSKQFFVKSFIFSSFWIRSYFNQKNLFSNTVNSVNTGSLHMIAFGVRLGTSECTEIRVYQFQFWRIPQSTFLTKYTGFLPQLLQHCDFGRELQFWQLSIV